jgi:hypothetical protein
MLPYSDRCPRDALFMRLASRRVREKEGLLPVPPGNNPAPAPAAALCVHACCGVTVNEAASVRGGSLLTHPAHRTALGYFGRCDVIRSARTVVREHTPPIVCDSLGAAVRAEAGVGSAGGGVSTSGERHLAALRVGTAQVRDTVWTHTHTPSACERHERETLSVFGSSGRFTFTRGGEGAGVHRHEAGGRTWRTIT